MSDKLPIYVGMDGSVAALEAADLARAEAVSRDAPLVILHIGEADDRVLESAQARLRLRSPSVVASIRHVPGRTDTAAALAEHAADGCLLVVGHRGHGVARTSSAGSVAQHLIGIATVPTIVYRPLDLSCDGPEPRRVLVGVGPDGVPDTVLDFALSEAASRQAPLDIVCAAPDRDDHAGLSAIVAGSVHRFIARYPEVISRVHVRSGIDPAIALMVESHTAQLVVVGATTGTGTQSGSIAHALVHRAACPVAVVPWPPRTPVAPAVAWNEAMTAALAAV